MHVSLDGFVAGPNGEMDWIIVNEEMFDYAKRQTDEADIALYGRKTWEMMEAYWPTAGDQPKASRHDKDHSSWYNQVRKIVISHAMEGKELSKTTVIGHRVNDHIKQLKEGDGKNIVMFGSASIARELMKDDLIDDYWLFINPIALGEGIPLFAGSKHQLQLDESKVFDSGVVALHYRKK